MNSVELCTFPILGMEIKEAIKLVESVSFSNNTKYQMRIVKKDGEACIVTRDYRLDRVNVEVENGKVIKMVNFG